MGMYCSELVAYFHQMVSDAIQEDKEGPTRILRIYFLFTLKGNLKVTRVLMPGHKSEY